ncbi:ketoacyl-ACP synthase III [Bordetella avium]|uniref:ketoacyl-ACP synthase III n=1 Tax=Bordetella avium TaxID=521 RepID=UPI000317F067|nr:ketoacyl-ACP synthase III [Bordetella avium]AZY50422.1 ketoacyl-ACP synthase III [Bordetella avium]AZY53818.1 ketoacyl-ACP synthase III [Bordetella avium]RIQ15409.1 ketoacyl-ACP synthase III [Bordetella avium]RIQ19784.1 ketoacyl-ACP synthase III [Bordetella avium]RIQ34365.1 ketoacyl-ACP synthase III [Bordetella avium]
MSLALIEHVAIRGLVTVMPEALVDNLDVPADQLRQRERLVKNIGIRWRRYCSGSSLIFSDLAQHAAEKLLQGLAWDPASVDALILVTQSPEFLIPATSIILQHRLGLPITTLAFDINLGCSGYPYGVFVCASMMGDRRLRRVILLAGDQSASGATEDVGREVLFSDACTATALEYDPSAEPMYFHGRSDGSGYDAIIMPHGGKRFPMRPDSHFPISCRDGVRRAPNDVWLDGPAVLNFSTDRAPRAIAELLGEVGIATADVDYFVLHQANRMINETIRKKIGVDEKKWPSSLYDYGNTSSASIPVTITARLAQQASEQRLRWVWCGFGIGLSWGTLYLETKPFYVPELITLGEKYDFSTDRFS